ncbi:MAG: ROK family protein [Verrucomicrobia bacterium]|nr:ROK family protein [Verrucomicrobiota bacterium]
MLGATILYLRSGQAVSRTSLAQLLGASASTLCLYAEQLIAEGYIREIGIEKPTIGRPQRLLGLVPEVGWFAGIEFNAQRIQLTAIDFAGKPITSAVCPLGGDPRAADVLQLIFSELDKLVASQTSPLLGIGIGAPGLVDRKRGVSRYFSFIKNWHDIPLADMLRKRFKVEVTLENNLRGIALAERWFGGGHNLKDYVILGPRSGFGLSIMHNGQLMHGAHEVAGEVGLWSWPQPEGDRALHDTLSATAIYRRMAGLQPDAPLPEDLNAAFKNVAQPGSAEWQRAVLDFARVIRTVQLIVDPEIFFLHGPLTALGESFCQDIQTTVEGLSPKLPDMQIKIVPSTLGDDAGALGAASLAMETWDPAR